MAQRLIEHPIPGPPARLHDRSVRASVSDLAGRLQGLLSRRVTAYMVGVKDAKTINRWASGEVDAIRDSDVERRLRTAYEISTMLLAVDSPRTVKAWFVSLNPQLDDLTPVEAIRSGRERDALVAARSFVANG